MELYSNTEMRNRPEIITTPKESCDENILATQAVIGSTITFGIMTLAIYVAPHVFQQFGIEVLK